MVRSACSGADGVTGDDGRFDLEFRVRTAGYLVAKPDAKVDCAEATFKVPKVECPSTDPFSSRALGIWVGVGGLSSGALDIETEDGSRAWVGVVVDCKAGRPTYTASFEVVGRGGFTGSWGVDVHAGDEVWTKAIYQGETARVFLINLTTGESAKEDSPIGDAGRLTASWLVSEELVSSPDDHFPLLEFENFDFFDVYATIDGRRAPMQNPSWDLLSLILTTEDSEIRASPLPPGQEGASFTMVWGDD